MQFPTGIGIGFKDTYFVSFVPKAQRSRETSDTCTDDYGFFRIQNEVNVRLEDTPQTTNLYSNCSILLIPAHQNTLLLLHLLIGQQSALPEIP